eukprot:1005451-Rhodomonas_salina.2
MQCAVRTACGARYALATQCPVLTWRMALRQQDFEKTLQRCRPSVSEDDLAEFEKFTKEFGQDG